MLPPRSEKATVEQNSPRIARMGPVSAWFSSRYGNRMWWMPPGPLFHNIPTIWRILGQIADQWHQVATEYQKVANSTTWPPTGRRGADLLGEIKPHYIQCLFSYVTFFLILKHAYVAFSSSLRDLNHRANLGLDRLREPAETSLRRKLTLVRDKAIAHYGDMNRISRGNLDSIVGLQWDFITPTTDGGCLHVEELGFGGLQLGVENAMSGTTKKSKPRRLPSIPKIHQACLKYLGQFDRNCAEYLDQIHAKLPVEVNAVLYRPACRAESSSPLY